MNVQLNTNSYSNLNSNISSSVENNKASIKCNQGATLPKNNSKLKQLMKEKEHSASL